MATEQKTLVTPEFRITFIRDVLVGNAEKKGKRAGQLKYTANMLFEPGVDLGPLRALVAEVGRDKWGDKLKTFSKPPEKPFQDMSDSNADGAGPGVFLVRASTFNKIRIVTAANPNVDIDPAVVKSGDYFRAKVHAYAWEYREDNGPVQKRGVSIGLGNMQFVRVGEALAGGYDAGDPADDFGPIEGAASIDDLW